MHEPKYLATAAVCSLLASAAVLAAPPRPNSTVIIACYNAQSGRARIVESATDCERHERYMVWNITGPPLSQRSWAAATRIPPRALAD